MAEAFIVTLERELPEAMAVYVKGKTGKALFRESDRIDSAARRRSVTQMTGFLSENPTALIAQMTEEGFDPAKIRVPAEQWFPASEGLKSVRALLDHVNANLNDFKQPNPILRDLRAVEALLTEAAAADVQFHLTRTVL